MIINDKQLANAVVKTLREKSHELSEGKSVQVEGYGQSLQFVTSISEVVG